jgi:hypothetical protein
MSSIVGGDADADADDAGPRFKAQTAADRAQFGVIGISFLTVQTMGRYNAAW